MQIKIYTKTGDGGETSLIGKRISKDAEVLDVLGSIDELNASLGIVTAHLNKSTKMQKLFRKEIARLDKMHSDLFSISSIIAGAKIELDIVGETKFLEEEIDLWTDRLKPLTNFILPGGSEVSSHIHLSRTICRSVERTFVGYTNVSESRPEKYQEMRKFFNRLSDWLFTLARYSNAKLKVSDKTWKSNPDSLSLFS